jgi:hypothetical protein
VPRPRNQHETTELKVAAVTPKLLRYLDAIVGEEGYGNSRSEVAKTLIWRGIEELISKGVLDRIRGKLNA